MSTYDAWLDGSIEDYFSQELPADLLTDAFPDYESLSDLARYTYKYTSCGPSVGALIRYVHVDQDPEHTYEEFRQEWFYGEDLKQWGDFKDMIPNGTVLMALEVSSIVEGVDQCCESIEVDANPFLSDGPTLREAFYKAVEEVNSEANSIWNETHGCDDCFDYPKGELHPIDLNCKTCGGEGVII